MNHNYDWALRAAVYTLNEVGPPDPKSPTAHGDRVEWAKLQVLVSIAMSLRDIVEKGR